MLQLSFEGSVSWYQGVLRAWKPRLKRKAQQRMAQQSHKATKPQSHNKAQQRMATKIQHDISLTYLGSTTVLN